jgi:glycine/D-amino acid oxidase-like deaminating enzyme
LILIRRDAVSSLSDLDHHFDTIVVGNGGLGTSLALVLARRGLRVACVGERERPRAASAAAGAMNGCFGEVTPSLLASDYGRMKLDMDVRATALWKDWERSLIEDSDEDAIRVANGTIVILNTIGVPAIDTAGYASIRVALEEYEEPFEDLDPDDIDWLDPVPTSRSLKAMLIPGEHAIDTPALLRALNTAFARAKGTLVDSQVLEVLGDGTRVTGVQLASGESLQADTVVLAAGASSYGLLGVLPEEVRDRVPAIVAGAGVALLVNTADGQIPSTVIRTPNRAFACGLHAVPRGDGRIYLGATNEIVPSPINRAAIGEINLLLGGIRQLRADLVNGTIEQVLVGNRPVSLDGFPLIGEVGLDGLWMLTGTYRDGLHQSPLLAAEMAARILGEDHDTRLDVFTPARSPLQGMSRAQCLETAVKHTMAVGYEHDWSLPEDLPPLIEEQFRNSFTRTLEEIDPEFVPPPEMLFFVDDEILAALGKYYAAHRR